MSSSTPTPNTTNGSTARESSGHDHRRTEWEKEIDPPEEICVFTNWLAGGGIWVGVTHGESDQWGYKPLDRNRPTEVYDIHATVLHLLGIDHEQLIFHHNGIDRRLTDMHGRVIGPLMA